MNISIIFLMEIFHKSFVKQSKLTL